MWPYVKTYMYCSTESNGGVDQMSVLTSNSQCRSWGSYEVEGVYSHLAICKHIHVL